MSIVDINGKPIKQVTTHAQTRDDLPGWVHSLGYRADDDVITLRVVVPESTVARAHVLALESTPDDLRALLDALQRCLTQSEQTMQILDVPAESSG